MQLLEEYKQSFEETLAEKTTEVNQTLNRIHELVSELQELAQIEKVNKYLRVSMKVMALCTSFSFFLQEINLYHS